MNDLQKLSVLGCNSPYPDNYCPSLLESLPRSHARETLNIVSSSLPFSGFDLWTAYELSWLNNKGKPVVAIGEFEIPASSPNLIESKSLKLYLNSFNQKQFKCTEDVIKIIKADLSDVAGDEVIVRVYSELNNYKKPEAITVGVDIDSLDIEINDYSFKPELLVNAVDRKSKNTSEIIFSNLLKSNCLMTNQPDWGSVFIKYEGKEINKESLLKYIISFRNHNEFHEQCVERIFKDIQNFCSPTKLTVFARYTRRGGLDINPFRSNFEGRPFIDRLPRQ